MAAGVSLSGLGVSFVGGAAKGICGGGIGVVEMRRLSSMLAVVEKIEICTGQY